MGMTKNVSLLPASISATIRQIKSGAEQPSLASSAQIQGSIFCSLFLVCTGKRGTETQISPLGLVIAFLTPSASLVQNLCQLIHFGIVRIVYLQQCS